MANKMSEITRRVVGHGAPYLWVIVLSIDEIHHQKGNLVLGEPAFEPQHGDYYHRELPEATPKV